MDAGEELGATASEIEMRSADVKKETAWNRGLVILRIDTLASAVTELNRYSAKPLVLASPDLAKLRVSGVFQSARPEAFLATLELRFGVTVRAEGASIAIPPPPSKRA